MGVTPDRISGFLVLASCFALLTNAAAAAPPASCVCKFVGEWSYPGGTTTVYANGTAQPHCANVRPGSDLDLQTAIPISSAIRGRRGNSRRHSWTPTTCNIRAVSRHGRGQAPVRQAGRRKNQRAAQAGQRRQRERRSIGATRNAFRRRTATRSRNAITDSPISAPSPRKWSVPASRNGSESRLRRSEAQRRCRAWSAASVSVDLKLFVVNGPRRCGRRTRPGF